MLLNNANEQIFKRGKHSEGPATARKPGKRSRENRRLISATCRYSSWERRAFYEILDQEEGDSIVDSLSRYLAESQNDSKSKDATSPTGTSSEKILRIV